MKIELIRDIFRDTYTLGTLYIDGIFECYTLEDKDRYLDTGGKKIKGKTAIPAGQYHVILNTSPRFNKVLPLLENVDQFEGVRIHTGNTDADTEGCILVGTLRQDNGTEGKVLNSRVAMERIMNKLQQAQNITISIIRDEDD